ncbi:MAG: hypothetical protein JWN26_172 [Candidatus Saccharibacteria bacterium]|nr:hypothetical protein [Candidatus Saccharibacteria bacterium]
MAFFAEAYREDEDMSNVHKSVTVLCDLGYEVTQGSTDVITSPRTDRNGFIGIVRPGLGSGSVMQAGTRRGFLACVHDSESGRNITVGGIHLDDRNEDERLKQITELPDLDVLIGDLNAMHRSAPIASILRLLKPVTEQFQEVNTDFKITTKRTERFKSLAQRLVRMADGRTLKILANEHGLFDIDPRKRSTIHNVAQIDHIVTRNVIHANNYKVHRDLKLSDHVPISADLTYLETAIDHI